MQPTHGYSHRRHLRIYALNSLCGISLNATKQEAESKGQTFNPYSQFPLWDFGECNPVRERRTVQRGVSGSQFPLWDFGECNPMPFRLFFGELAGKISGSYRLPRSCNSPYKDKNTIKGFRTQNWGSLQKTTGKGLGTPAAKVAESYLEIKLRPHVTVR
jgi:hypothetical protein